MSRKTYKQRQEFTVIGRYKASIGKRFGVLKVLDVIRKVDDVRGQSNIYYVVRCDCGNKRKVSVNNFHCSGHSRCGCGQSKKIKGKGHRQTIKTAFMRAQKSCDKDRRKALSQHERMEEQKMMQENVAEVWEIS